MKDRITALFHSNDENPTNGELIDQLADLFNSTIEEKKERMIELRNQSISRMNTPQFTHKEAVDACVKILEE